ncbi:MAG: Gfo/Idh/MocA family oxidoreductase [Nitrososphaeria archaeon]
MDKQVKVAVIGAGYWGEKLIEEYIKLSTKRPTVKLQAIVDQSLDRLNYIKNKYNLPEKMLYKDYKELLNNDNEVNAVHIATPNETHYQIAMDSLENGKHILLEKPMTLSSRTAFKLAREAEKSELVLLIGHIFRYNNAINLAKKLVHNNVLGKINFINIKWVTHMENLPVRDIIFDLAPHPIDIINHILEEWPTSVYSKARSFKRGEKGLEDSAFIIIDLPGNAIAGVTLSWIQPGAKTRTVEIVGDKSTLYIDALTQKMQLYDNSNKQSEIKVEANNTIETQLNHFIDRIINKVPPLSSPLIGAMTVYILEKLKESIEKNSSVEIMAPI